MWLLFLCWPLFKLLMLSTLISAICLWNSSSEMFGMGSESFRRKLCKIMHEQIIACIFVCFSLGNLDLRGLEDKEADSSEGEGYVWCQVKDSGSLDVDHITACIKRNTAIIQYNAIARNSNSIPLPPLPYIDWVTGIVTVVNATHHKTDRGIHDKKIINASLPKNFSSLMNDWLFFSIQSLQASGFWGFRLRWIEWFILSTCLDWGGLNDSSSPLDKLSTWHPCHFFGNLVSLNLHIIESGDYGVERLSRDKLATLLKWCTLYLLLNLWNILGRIINDFLCSRA